MNLKVEPLTCERWVDLVELFERPGASIARGCYCMFYRRSGRHELPPGLTYSEANKRALKDLVDHGVVPGLIGYHEGRPIGWVSLGPREAYAKLERSPVMKSVDARAVWSIICFFADAGTRHRGVAEALLRAALKRARTQGATLVEAYPCDKASTHGANSMWFGAKSMFDRVGFVEVARRTPARPVMRKGLRRSTHAL